MGVTYRPPQTRPYSLVTSLPVTIVSPLGARPQPPGPKALFNMRRYLISGRYRIPSGLISMSSGCSSACRIALCSAVKGELERPWYERVQSTCRSLSSRVGGGSTRPSVRECRDSEDSGARLLPLLGLATWEAAVCGMGVRGACWAGAGLDAGAAAG